MCSFSFLCIYCLFVQFCGYQFGDENSHVSVTTCTNGDILNFTLFLFGGEKLTWISSCCTTCIWTRHWAVLRSSRACSLFRCLQCNITQHRGGRKSYTPTFLLHKERRPRLSLCRMWRKKKKQRVFFFRAGRLWYQSHQRVFFLLL